MFLTFEDTATDNLIFTTHAEKYYRLTILKATRPAVDEWLAKVDMIWEAYNGGDYPLRILCLTATDTQIPINYAFREGMKLVRKYRDLPPASTAFVIRNRHDMMISLTDSFLRLMPMKINYRFFVRHQEASAIAWLLALETQVDKQPI